MSATWDSDSTSAPRTVCHTSIRRVSRQDRQLDSSALWWSLSQAAGRESRPSSDRLLAAGGLLTGLGAPDPEPAAAQPPASSQDSDVRVYLSPFQNSLLSSVPLKEPPRTQPHLPGCVGTPPLGPGSSLGLGASYPSRWCLSPCHVCFCFLL